MTVGELIQKLAQYDFRMDVSVFVNKVCLVDIDNIDTRGKYPYETLALYVDVETDELTE